MSQDSLAILGGTPLRTKPFMVEPMLDGEEERLVVEAVRNKNFSRYIGIAAGNDVLTMTSAEADGLSDNWHVLGGPNVRRFAALFAKEMGVPYAIPVTSATAGLSLALAAAGVGPGDEVILPGISFSATGNAVLMYDSIPVFVDVDPTTFCIDPKQVEKAITPRTRAILPVHLAGNVADMDAILALAAKHGLKVIEDSAQAIGASWRGRKTGTLGDAGVFSFQQSKNIMTGEGGMIVTSNPDIAKRCRLILNHGEACFDKDWSDDELANIIGFNFRMPELCAALGIAQMGKLHAVNQWRTERADLLRQELSGLPGLRVSASQRSQGQDVVEVPHFLAVHYIKEEMGGLSRQLFVAALREEGLPVGTGYARPMYASPHFLRRIAYGRQGYPWIMGNQASPVSYSIGQCPVCEKLLGEEFLWFYHVAYPSTDEDMRDIAKIVRKVIDNKEALLAAALALTDKLGGHSAGRLGVAPAQVKKG